jgi:predicted transcriptional regulator
MKLVPCENTCITNVVRRGDIQGLIMEFMEQDADCAEVTNFHHKDAKSCVHSLHQAVIALRVHNNVGVSRRGGKVYLYKKHHDE